MILTDFKDFPRNGRIMGIDWGAKRTGLAVSDERREFVFPRGVVRPPRREGDMHFGIIQKILQIIKDENIVGIVVGLPLRGDGSESDTTRAVRLFSAELAERTDLPIVFINENLTSMEAEERQKAKGRKESLDSEAAAVILENAIALMKRNKNE
jgi:putative Holliday junction resolvase